MLKIITNADDLGYSADVNDEIFRLMDVGKITSATLLAAGLAIEDAAGRIKNYPSCSFGVHLNLTEFHPLTDRLIWKKNGLLNEAGNFNGKIRSAKISRELCYAVFEEWCTQIDKSKRFGIVISHLDSHHHVHTIPWLLPVLKLVQKKYGIKKVRKSMNLFSLERSTQPLQLRINKWLWNCALTNFYKSTVTDYFTSFHIFNKMAACSPKKYQGTIELMAHPGIPSYAEETLAIASNWVNFSHFAYSSISYNDL